MAYEYTAYRKVEFSDTDMAGLVHFSNYFRYMEIAERDFFESLGVKLIQSIPNDLVGYPRSRAECKFSAPLRFGDTVKIHLAIKAIKDRAIDYQFRLFRDSDDNLKTENSNQNPFPKLFSIKSKKPLNPSSVRKIRKRLANSIFTLWLLTEHW